MGTEKISVSDHINGYQYITDKSDNFVIDMESCPSKDVPANPRFNRSLSRKWSLRGVEEKVIPSNIANEKNEKDTILLSPSPRGAQGGGVMVPEKAVPGTTEQCNNPTPYHQITVSTANMGTNSEGRYLRRNSLRRSSSSISWILDPKRILFVFATLSSIGTIMLIYFTLSMGKSSADGDAVLDLQQ